MISFSNFKEQYRDLEKELKHAFDDVFESGWFVLGENVAQFENEFAAYCSVNYGIGVGSGTDALFLALIAADVKQGDEVITVANTAVPTISAISAANAVPVFVDIDPQTYTLNPQLIEEKITSRTKVILPVHLYGQSADMDPILEIAKQYKLKVIEDACQAHGALYKNKKVGSLGDLGCFSFYPSKNLGCYGDGGMIVTNNSAYAEKLRMLRNYGQRKRYYHEIKGINSRLDELQAAFLRKKLPHLNGWNKRRREIADIYASKLNKSVIVPREHDNNYHVYHLYVIRCGKRDELQKYLTKNNIETLIHYPVPVHLQNAYLDLKLKADTLPNTKQVASEILSLPLYPELPNNDAVLVSKKINKFFELNSSL